jgi:large subunit ribosomal protein L5
MMATEAKDKQKKAAPQGQVARGGAKPQPDKRKAAPREEPAAPPITFANLLERYRTQITTTLRSEFGYENVMQVPRVEKIIINIGLGESVSNAKALDAAASDLTTITGQRPIVTRAKKSISNFRLRKGMPIGVKVTLRGLRMWHFLEKLVNVALPRIRDFQGVPDRSFDGRGNFSLGLREQLVFPEVEYDRIDRLRGMEITVVTTAKTDEEGRRLLQLLGMPFKS